MIDRFQRMPSALKANARWLPLGEHKTPALVVHPDWAGGQKVPLVLWMHGRTAKKEIDPGRYLRWMRAGIGTCALDLPGHGERYVPSLHKPNRSFDLITQMLGELDSVLDAVAKMKIFSMQHLGIGGISAGGMVTLARMCRDHPFVCASVEATSGSWMNQHCQPMFGSQARHEIEKLDPVSHLEHWREIPLQAIHARHDEWVSIEGQREFLDKLKCQYQQPNLVEWIEYDRTGAPYEHAGFGKMAADAKNRQRDFFMKQLIDNAPRHVS